MFPLEGIKVLDLMTLSGYCGMELADYGAEVIKVESPEGDPLRSLAPLKNGASVHHAFRDRGKKSITLNLQHPEGKEIFKKLVATADVVLENFAPNTMEELGLGYDVLSAIKPSLVYGRISGYGSTGEGANMPQLDLIAQAKSAVMHFTGFPENEPTRLCDFRAVCSQLPFLCDLSGAVSRQRNRRRPDGGNHALRFGHRHFGG